MQGGGSPGHLCRRTHSLARFRNLSFVNDLVSALLVFSVTLDRRPSPKKGQVFDAIYRHFATYAFSSYVRSAYRNQRHHRPYPVARFGSTFTIASAALFAEA